MASAMVNFLNAFRYFRDAQIPQTKSRQQNSLLKSQAPSSLDAQHVPAVFDLGHTECQFSARLALPQAFHLFSQSSPHRPFSEWCIVKEPATLREADFLFRLASQHPIQDSATTSQRRHSRSRFAKLAQESHPAITTHRPYKSHTEADQTPLDF